MKTIGSIGEPFDIEARNYNIGLHDVSGGWELFLGLSGFAMGILPVDQKSCDVGGNRKIRVLARP